MVDYDIAKGQSVDTPVFLAIGRDDYQVPYSLWDNERTKLPRLSYNLFEKSGHYPMLEEQELFDKKLLEWIRSQQ
jgi:proline iminopeptidase